jgi:hypothetical protein
MPMYQSYSSYQPPSVPIPGYKAKTPVDTGMISEDNYKIIPTTWTDGKVVRIGTIGEGSCFFHSYVKGYYGPYQDSRDNRWKMSFIANLRRDLGNGLTLIKSGWDGNVGTPVVPHYLPENERTYYNSYFYGLSDVPGYTLNDLMRIISDWRECVGDEVYQYVVDILGIGLIVFQINEYGFRVTKKYTSSSDIPGGHKYVGVVNIPGHYELIGIERDINGQLLFQTLFTEDDPFIQSIDIFDELSRESNNIRNRIGNLIRNIGNVFKINDLDSTIKNTGRYEYAADVIRDIGWDNFIQYLTNLGVDTNSEAVQNYLYDIANLNDEVIALLGENL